ARGEDAAQPAGETPAFLEERFIPCATLPPLVTVAPESPMKVEFRRIGMSFGASAASTIRVLEDINLEVRTGEFVCILGPSGCGKSTLLNIVGGFIKPSEGSVAIDGEAVTGPDPRRIFVFQERGVFPWLTVEGNIGFGLFRQSPQEKRERVAHYVQLVGLRGFEKAYPRELSGGMKQRLEVARALAVDPDVLYLDEPFGALDSITRLQMRRELLRIWHAERKTILFVTHDIEESVQLADRVVVLSARPGRVQRVVYVNIPHPRDLSDPRYIALRDQIFGEIGLAHQV
ncbi:MAG: ABC transporter ATP-binding protein, partial [Acidobacteriota bacterium]